MSQKRNTPPPLLRRNFDVRRAVIRALDHPKKRHLPDRELGREIGVDHRTIGRWRRRLEGGEVPHKLLTKKQFLNACRRVSETLPDEMWRELLSSDTACVYEAYSALHRVLHGGRTLLKRLPKRAR